MDIPLIGNCEVSKNQEAIPCTLKEDFSLKLADFGPGRGHASMSIERTPRKIGIVLKEICIACPF